jgi:hypothetical protein
MTVPLLWDEAVGRLRSRVFPQNFDMWLRPIELLSFDGVTLRLRAAAATCPRSFLWSSREPALAPGLRPSQRWAEWDLPGTSRALIVPDFFQPSARIHVLGLKTMSRS